MKKIPFGYQSDLETLEEFFVRCGDKGLGTFDPTKMTKEEFIRKRCEIWEELVTELRAIRMNEKDVNNVIKNKRVIGFKKGNTK